MTRAYKLPPCTPEQKLLAERNLGFVYWLLGKFLAAHSGARAHKKDLEQAGMVGLVEACIRYEPARGQLSTYAEHHVVSRMRQELKRLSQQVVAPRLGAGGYLGMAPALAQEPEEQLAGLAGEGLGVESEVEARLLYESALEGISRHLGEQVPNARRDAELFLTHLLWERTDSETADILKVSRVRVGVLRGRTEAAFRRWCAEENRR